MTRKQKKMLLRILVSAGMMLVLAFLPAKGLWRFALYLIPYFVIGWDILYDAIRGIAAGQVFDENFLMAVATVGALILGAGWTGDYGEAVAVMLFYQIGELFQSYAVGKSRRSIGKLMDIRPDYANIRQDGTLFRVDPETVTPGTVIWVQPGERIPIDGTVVEGTSQLDTAALTGESIPKCAGVGDAVVSGCINLTGLLAVETTREFSQSTVAKILELTENAGANKSRSETVIARFARVYTPAVCIGALLLAVLPPVVQGLITGAFTGWGDWLYRALTFLVVSCPCALVISVPLTFFAGIGGASRMGILVKGGNFLEALGKTDGVVFDKTGTLTQGSFQVKALLGDKPQALLEYAALAESASTHPIGKSILACYGKTPHLQRVGEIQEISGKGVTAFVDGKPVAVGNRRLMEQFEIACPKIEQGDTLVYVAVDGGYFGCIVIGDTAKPNAKKAVEKLKKAGVSQLAMLTGDREEAARSIARELGIGEVYSQLLPGDKVAVLEKLLKNRKGRGKLAFVGDGINDAPVLTRADVGIAMGAMGSDAAIEAADVVLMDDDPEKIALAIRHARRCMRIVRQNIIFAIGVKAACLLLSAMGLAGMGLAIFADVGVMVLAVCNAIGALFVKGAKK